MVASNVVAQHYVPRIVDAQVERYLNAFGAVEIAGTKWCGKTWTALRHGASVSYVDDDLDAAKGSPELMLLGDRPHVIDEWQLVPRIWDAVRRAADHEYGLRGGWILTGSSTPLPSKKDAASRPSHSGAGRFGRIRMHPMSLAESGDSTATVSLRALFDGEFEPCAVDSDVRWLADAVCRGGWPEVMGRDVSDAQLLAREYLRLFFTESVVNQGKDGEVAQRLTASLARNMCQAATYGTLAADMYGVEGGNPFEVISQNTLIDYLAIIKANYLVEEVPGWVPQSRSRKRLSVKPKRYLADPSIATALLGMGPDALLRDWQTFGLAFENLCIRDIMVYVEAMPDVGLVPIRYYRDDSGLEADVVIELSDGRWAAIEIKLSEDKVDDGVASLRRLQKKLCGNEHTRCRKPEFLAVVVGISRYARQVDDGIFVIPVRALGA